MNKRLRLLVLFLISIIGSYSAATAQTLEWEKLINPGECPPVFCFWSDMATSTVYMGGRFGSIYKTTDLGNSWVMIDTVWKDTPVHGVVGVDSLVLTSNKNGMFKSRSLGSTWSQISGSFGNYITLVMGFYHGAILDGHFFAGAGYTLDSGAHWHPLPTYVSPGHADNSVYAFCTFNDTLYAGSQWGVTKLPFDGAQFSGVKLNDGFTSETEYYNVSALAALDTSLFCVSDSGVFCLDNQTQKWSRTSIRLRSSWLYIGNTYALVSQGKYLFAGTDSGILRSGDRGKTWDLVNADIADTVRALTVIGNTIFAGTNFCVYRSTDSGNSWKAAINGLTYRLYPVTCFSRQSGVLYCGTDGGGVYKSSNSGLSWEAFNGGRASLSVRTLTSYNSWLMVGSADGALINSGYLWQPYNEGFTTSSVYSYSLIGNSLLAGTGKGGVYRLNTSDTAWTSLGAIPSLNYVAAVATINSRLFAGTNGDGAYMSSDEGKNWESISAIADQRVIAYATIGPYVFAATGGNGVFRSSDNGDHWEQVNTGLSNQKVRSLIAYSSFLFAATDDGVFESKNQGANWTQENNGLQTLKMASLYVSGSYIYAATNGSGIYRAYLGERDVRLDNANTPFWVVYPNPASDMITIKKTNGLPSAQKIAILTVLGEKILELKGPISDMLSVDVHSLAPGKYFVAITEDNRTTIYPLIITGHE